MELPDLLVTFTALAGVGAFVALLVNVLKTAGVVHDGDAKTWATGLNLVGLVALYILRLVRPDVELAQVDQVAATVAQIGVLVLGLVAQLGVSQATHAIVKGVPLVGTSHTAQEPPSFTSG